MQRTSVLLCRMIFLLLALELAAETAGQTLRKVAVIELPGPPGQRFDYLSIDADDHYLLSTHLGAGLLYVIDLRSNRLVATIPDLPGIEAVEYVPEVKKAYASVWYENKIAVIELRQKKIVKKLETEAKPDGIAYAAPFHKIYVSDERGRAEAVVDVRTDTIVKTLRFGSETGVPQFDPVTEKVYVNLQEENTLAVIDPASDTVEARYPLGRCRGNHGMALDPQHRRAFLSCEGNDLLTVFDLENHQPIAYLPMAPGADVVAFDPGLQRIYAACSSGAIAVFQEDDPGHFRKLENFPVVRNVHSLAVDTETHRVYAPEQEENGHPVSRMVVYEAVVEKPDSPQR